MSTDVTEQKLGAILAFARSNGRTPKETQALIIAGGMLTGFDAIASGLADLVDVLDALHDVAGALREYLDEPDEEKPDPDGEKPE